MVTKCPGARRRWLNADGSSPKKPKKHRRKKVKKSPQQAKRAVENVQANYVIVNVSLNVKCR